MRRAKDLWADRSLRSKSLIVLAIPLLTFVLTAPFVYSKLENRRATIAVVAVAPLGLLGGVVAGLLFTNGVSRRVRRVSDNAVRLAEGAAFLPMPAGRDEVGKLAAALLETRRHLDERDAAVRDNEAMLRAVVDNTTSVIFLKDRDGRFLLLNHVFERLFGIRQEDAIGRSVFELFPGEDAAAWHENDLTVMRDRTPVQFEETASALDGERVFLSTKVPILDEGGEPYALVGISTDITERKRSQEEIRVAREEAERANRAKTEFLSRMSHELRTPLNAVLGFAQLLDMDRLGDEQRDNVGQIRKAGLHLLDLINEVLDIAGIEAGKLTMSPEPVRIGDAVRDALDLIRPLADGAGISIRLGNEVNGTYVLADRQRLKQILLNLLSNAVKYNRPGGSVELTGRGREGVYRIHVTDTGPGIRAEEMERLFTPFDRLAHRNGEIEGTGLGLPLSRGLVEAMGGNLAVRSTPGRGSTFTIELPVSESPVASYERMHAGSAPDSRRASTGTILYIEDNVSNLRLIDRVLSRRPGVRLISAMQGSIGVELARRHRPDLVLLDLHLPDMEGVEALRALRGDERTAGIAVVVLSADVTPSQIDRLTAARAHGYLTKPLDVNRFLEIVDGVLERNDVRD